jgi:hypothetical protein
VLIPVTFTNLLYVVSGLCLWGVTFFFVPRHAVVQENESADRLAGCAVVADGQPIDRIEMVNHIIEIGRN